MLILVALALGPLFLTGPAAALLYIALLRRGHRRAMWVFWALLVVSTAWVGVLIAHTFSDFFPGPGCFATLLTPATAILSLIVFRFQAKRFYQVVGDDLVRRRRFQLAMLLFAALQLSAPPIGLCYSRSCDLINRRASRPIVAALERYHEEHGRYPTFSDRHQSDLGFLVPEYLDAIPPLACRVPQIWSVLDSEDDDWRLYNCPNSPGQPTLLLAPIVGTDSQQIYNPETRRWSRGSSFDGYCP